MRRTTKVTSKGQKCVAEDHCRGCHRPLEKFKFADAVIKCHVKMSLIGWKDEVSLLPCYQVEYYSTTLFTFCWLRLATIETAQHCQRVAESMNAKNSRRHATACRTKHKLALGKEIESTFIYII